MICKKGHEFQGDENTRARKGWCPHCFQEVRRRYRASEKAKATNRRYRQTDAAREQTAQRNARTNPRRIRVGAMYLGVCGFSVTETEAMLNGSTDRPRHPGRGTRPADGADARGGPLHPPDGGDGQGVHPGGDRDSQQGGP